MKRIIFNFFFNVYLRESFHRISFKIDLVRILSNCPIVFARGIVDKRDRGSVQLFWLYKASIIDKSDKYFRVEPIISREIIV